MSKWYEDLRVYIGRCFSVMTKGEAYFHTSYQVNCYAQIGKLSASEVDRLKVIIEQYYNGVNV